jgi:hypothetical protein
MNRLGAPKLTVYSLASLAQLDCGLLRVMTQPLPRTA